MEPHKHHQQQPHCFNRPKYREGNRPRAVKVYTIAQESRYLLVQGVPALGAAQELVQLFALYGAVQEYHAMDEYPAEPFTDVYLIKYGDVHSARVAKRRLDERSFFGGVLHVCYAPEFESVEEARSKLQARRRYVERIARMPGPVLPDDKHGDTGKPTSRSPPHHEPKRGRREPHNEDEQASGDQEPSFPTYSFPMIPPPPQHLPPAARMPPSWRLSEDTEGYRESREHSDSRQRATLAGHTESRGPLNHEVSRRKNEAVARFVPRSALLEARNQLRLEGGMGGRTSHQDVNEPLVGPMLGPMLPPEIPKDVDLGDASLNASAELIRDRIRQHHGQRFGSWSDGRVHLCSEKRRGEKKRMEYGYRCCTVECLFCTSRAHNASKSPQKNMILNVLTCCQLYIASCVYGRKNPNTFEQLFHSFICILCV